jgi:adenylate cyclase
VRPAFPIEAGRHPDTGQLACRGQDGAPDLLSGSIGDWLRAHDRTGYTFARGLDEPPTGPEFSASHFIEMTDFRRSHFAAILAADAVGFSRAMSRDEIFALRALSASRAVIDAAIGGRGGRIFATGGDSVLAEFSNAADAVAAAVDVQHGLAAAAGPVLEYRIGVHCGLVHPHGNDLLGDTVNIASRLESLAYSGGICISAQAHDAAGNALDLELVEIGPQVLKNILDPVRVLRVRVGEPEPVDGMERHSRSSSVAVLAFRSLSGESERYLGEGLAEDIVMGLSRFQSLSILSGNSRMQRDEDADLRRLASELGVSHVVHGSVRRLPDRLRISVHLTDGFTGNTLWAERFDPAGGDLVAVQDEIVQRLVAMIVGRIETETIAAARRKRPESAAAFDLLLQGIHHANRLDPPSNALALALFEKAVAREPEYALAWAWLALMRLRHWAWKPGDADMRAADVAARRALAIDPSESWCQLVVGQVAMYRRDFGPAEVHHKKALSLNPYDCHIMALRSPLATYLGKPEEGIEWAMRAMSLFPGHPDWYATNLGLAHYCARNYLEAEQAYAAVAEPQAGVLAGLAASRAQLGDMEGAQATARELLKMVPAFSSELLLGMRPFRHEEDRNHLRQGLLGAGLPS